MKRMLSAAVCALFASAGFAQMLQSVHRRDNYEDFKLKSVATESQVIGPLVRNRTVYTFHNPYKALVEAVFDFSVNTGAALDGFAYWYKKDRVPGVLMDKRMAWFIYTAITSRDRDPGIMDMVSPTQFHAQIYPLAVGYDLRLELTTVDFLSPRADRFGVPQPAATSDEQVPQEWHVTGNKAPLADSTTSQGRVVAVQLPMAGLLDVQAVAQSGPGGRTFIAGIARGSINGPVPHIAGLHDLTIFKRSDDTNQASSGPRSQPYITGEKDAYMFVGWTQNSAGVTVTQSGQAVRVKPMKLGPGTVCSKLWAANQLARKTDWNKRTDVLAFSLKYQVPSSQTALLAVPKSEMKLFEKKKAEFQRQLARKSRVAKHQRRARHTDVNWNSNRGGDPELRIDAPEAKAVFARLPDGRVLTLRQLSDGRWGANFDVPADASEGDYVVKVTVLSKDGRVGRGTGQARRAGALRGGTQRGGCLLRRRQEDRAQGSVAGRIRGCARCGCDVFQGQDRGRAQGCGLEQNRVAMQPACAVGLASLGGGPPKDGNPPHWVPPARELSHAEGREVPPP